MEDPNHLTGIVTDAIHYVRCGERIRAAMSSLAYPLQEVKGLVELDASLAPELLTVLTNLDEANEALTRAFTFVTARYETSIERSPDA